MFTSPKYNYSSGLYRPERRVAAVGRTHSKYMEARGKQRRAGLDMAGNMVGAGGNQRQVYSPVYERAEAPTLVEEYLPTDSRTQNRLFRNILAYDAIAGTATEYWCSMAFGNELFLSGIDDNTIMHFYEDALASSGVVPLMPLMLNEYIVIGRLFYFMLPNPQTGYWSGTKILDPDYVRLVAPRLPNLDPIMDWQPNTEDQMWAVMNDPRAKKQRASIDPQIVKAMATGSALPLDPINSMFLPRKVHAADDNGMSYLCRVLPMKIYEKAIMDASIQASRRRAGPVWWATVPNDYKAEQIEQIIDQLFAAEEDPVGGKVAFREGVNITLLGNKDDVISIKDEWDWLVKAKMNALGISEAMLSGETNYNTLETVLSAFLEKLRNVRTLFTRKIVHEKIFRTLALQHGYVRRTQAELSHKLRISRKRTPSDADLILPKMEWDKSLEPRADKDYWDMLVAMEEKGIPIQLRKWAQAGGYDLREALSNQTSDLNDRAKIYAYKKALVEQAEKMGFDGKGQYIGSGGEGGGGGGGELGGLEGLGGGEGGLDLGGGEEGGGLGGLGGGEEAGGGGGGLPELGGGESAAPPTPPAGGEAGGGGEGGGGEGGPGGAGAGLLKARFKTNQPKVQYRKGSVYAKHVDLERVLDQIPIWSNDTVLDMPKRRVAQLVDELTRKDPQDRSGTSFYRWAKKEGLNTTQADVVEYCAARVGVVEYPEITDESKNIILKILASQADKTGLTPALDEEIDVVSDMLPSDPITASTGISAVSSYPLPDGKILTGLTK